LGVAGRFIAFPMPDSPDMPVPAIHKGANLGVAEWRDDAFGKSCNFQSCFW